MFAAGNGGISSLFQVAKKIKIQKNCINRKESQKYETRTFLIMVPQWSTVTNAEDKVHNVEKIRENTNYAGS